MHLRDTTVEINHVEDMQNDYLYHSESAQGRWGLGVEQVTPERFDVSVNFREPGWDVAGVIRYWTFAERALAEARYLELQRLFEGFCEDVTMDEVMPRLPATERRNS